ncbi:MAG TPA: YcjX family protein [Devosia sp.]|nr:YcjX family protein [Devosia sp.]
MTGRTSNATPRTPDAPLRPRWPHSTRRISQIRLSLKYQSARWLARFSGPATLNVDIVDYPGEWLLDLPLLSMNYAQWADRSLARLRSHVEQKEADAYLCEVAKLAATSPASEPLAHTLADMFTAFLRAQRVTGRAMSSLSPGRFLMPGDLEGSPALTFAPLPPELASGRTDSLHALMNRRFEAYKKHVVRPFFRDHFTRLDRQIVLVDVLRALNAGADAVTDLQDALNDVLSCFRQGANSPLSRIVARRIDRLLFAATKADHVHHTSHQRLETIIARLVDSAERKARFSGARTGTMAIAAIRATREGKITENGEKLDCLVGIPEEGEQLDGTTYDGTTRIALFPGDLPEHPEQVFLPTLKPGLLNFMRFAPPDDLGAKGTGLPHIRLDKALDFLLKDWMK